MAHIAQGWERRTQGRPAGLKSALLALRNAVRGIAGAAGKDAAAQTGKGRVSVPDTPAATDRYSEEVAAHVRSVIENGYFEEESGKRVFVPWYVRSLLINEMHRQSTWD